MTNKIIMQKENNLWKCEVNQNKINYTWGQIGGIMQELNVEIQNGKNIGKANETTKEQQALVEAKAKINNKIKEGYLIVSNTFAEKFKKQRECPQPMLAKEWKARERFVIADKNNKFFYQPKLDGIRCIANIATGKLYSRKGEEITTMPHIAKEVMNIGLSSNYPLQSEWLDGELYIHKKGFQTLMSIIRSNVNLHEEADTIEYHVYDYIDEYSGFETRNKILKNLFSSNSFQHLKFVEAMPILVNNIDDIHDEQAANGYEGIMIRLAHMPYETKRSSGLLKYKKFIQEEYLIVGFSKEKHNETLAALILQTEDGKSFEATPSMTDEEKLSIWNNQEEYRGKQYFATVKFQEYTDDKIPRFPVCIGIRHEDDMGS